MYRYRHQRNQNHSFWTKNRFDFRALRAVATAWDVSKVPIQLWNGEQLALHVGGRRTMRCPHGNRVAAAIFAYMPLWPSIYGQNHIQDLLM